MRSSPFGLAPIGLETVERSLDGTEPSNRQYNHRAAYEPRLPYGNSVETRPSGSVGIVTPVVLMVKITTSRVDSTTTERSELPLPTRSR